MMEHISHHRGVKDQHMASRYFGLMALLLLLLSSASYFVIIDIF